MACCLRQLHVLLSTVQAQEGCFSGAESARTPPPVEFLPLTSGSRLSSRVCLVKPISENSHPQVRFFSLLSLPPAQPTSMPRVAQLMVAWFRVLFVSTVIVDRIKKNLMFCWSSACGIFKIKNGLRNASTHRPPDTMAHRPRPGSKTYFLLNWV